MRYLILFLFAIAAACATTKAQAPTCPPCEYPEIQEEECYSDTEWKQQP